MIMKKIISFLTAVSLFMCGMNVFAKDSSFSDVKGHWAQEVINKYASNGYISGYPDGSFRPQNNVSVEEFCRIVCAVKGINYRILSGSWSLPYIREMIGNGVIERNDYEDYSMPMTREQVAKAVVSLMTGEYYPKNIEQFKKHITDAEQISAGYDEYVLKTYISGVLGGYDDASWKPRAGVTRAEILSVLERVFNKDMRVVPEILSNVSSQNPNQSYYYSAAVQVRKNTNANAMQYRLYGSDAIYLTEDDVSTGLKMVNEIQGAQGFAMILRYDISKLKENRDKLNKLYIDAKWVKNGSKDHALGLWYYTYDVDKTDWNNNLYYKNVNGSAIAGDDISGYNSVISNINATLPTWGNASMAIPNEEKAEPVVSAVRNAENKYIFDITELADEIILKAGDDNMAEFILTSVNYDGYMLDDDKPQIYIAGENAPKLNAEYNVGSSDFEMDYSDVSINLSASDATLNGGMLKIETVDDIENIAFFTPGQEILFEFTAPVEGDYLMKINSSASTSAGGIVGFSVNDEYFETEFPYGEGWNIYQWSDVKKVHLKQGKNVLSIVDVKLNATYLINIRNVSFELQ